MYSKDFNAYGWQLTAAEIEAGQHRQLVGGHWEKLGRLQLEFLTQRGLRPEHDFLDVGCGALRGGLHVIRYLQAGRYCGLDLNASLIEAGKLELAAAGLADQQPRLLVSDRFEFLRFERTFDFALAFSVFTHVYLNHIARCLAEIKAVLKPDGRFYATFFQAPHPVYLAPLADPTGETTTFYDSDPFHYALEELRSPAEWAGLTVELVADWQHPRGQTMVCFRQR